MCATLSAVYQIHPLDVTVHEPSVRKQSVCPGAIVVFMGVLAPNCTVIPTVVPRGELVMHILAPLSTQNSRFASSGKKPDALTSTLGLHPVLQELPPPEIFPQSVRFASASGVIAKLQRSGSVQVSLEPTGSLLSGFGVRGSASSRWQEKK